MKHLERTVLAWCFLLLLAILLSLSIYVQVMQVKAIEKLVTERNYELAKWLADGASCREFRQCKYDASFTAFTNYAYYDGTDNEPCSDNILIRSNGGEWHEPLVEVKE